MDETKKSSGSKLLKNNMESIILRALFDGKKYGYEIAKEIEEKTEGAVEVKQPTLYNVLKRLESNGLITSFWGEESHGGRRKYFSLTIEGFQLCQKQQSDWEYSRHLLDKLVSDKEFDGDKITPDIDISIDKKAARPPKSSAKKRISFAAEKEEKTEVLDIINDINNDLSSLPENSGEDAAIEQNPASPPPPARQEPAREDFLNTQPAQQSPFGFSEPERQHNLYNEERFDDEYQDAELDEDLTEEPPTQYYRDLDRNLDALMDDIDEVDDTIISTGSLLESLSKKAEKKPEPPREQFFYSDDLGHINMDYLFNLYGRKEEPKVQPLPLPIPAPAPTLPPRVHEDTTPEVTGKSFSASRDNTPVDIFEDGGELRRKSVAAEAEPEPQQSEAYVLVEKETPPAFIDYSEQQEESDEEREYKKIIGNLLYKKPEPEVEEDLPPSVSKSQPSTADKIMSSVGAATHNFNLDGFESTGDMPSVALTYPGGGAGAPIGYDLIYDLKERLSQEGIKLRQYEKSPKSTSERYDYYYKNKLLFAVLWIVYIFALAELSVIYLLFKDKAAITWQLLLTYTLIMLAFPLAGTVINYSQNNLKVKAEWDFGYRLRDSLIIFILGFFVIVAVDLIFFQFAFAVTDDVVIKLLIPSVMLFNVVLSTFIYRRLYRSKRYFVK